MRACTYACPARCYTWSEERGRVEFAYEACLECGTCLLLCDEGALDWHYPMEDTVYGSASRRPGRTPRLLRRDRPRGPRDCERSLRRGAGAATMRILVFIDVAADVRIPPERDPRSGRVRVEWLVREIDPASARALELALALAAGRPNGQITVIHLGPPAHEPFLRRALARGCHRAVRLWDEEAAEARTAGKAVILAAAAEAAGYDVVLTGSKGVIGAGGQLGVLVAAQLDVPL